MSFCPVCGKGQGNGGDPCRKCEALEARTEALTQDARNWWAKSPQVQDQCIACHTIGPCVQMDNGEVLCQKCYEAEIVKENL